MQENLGSISLFQSCSSIKVFLSPLSKKHFKWNTLSQSKNKNKKNLTDLKVTFARPKFLLSVTMSFHLTHETTSLQAADSVNNVHENKASCISVIRTIAQKQSLPAFLFFWHCASPLPLIYFQPS